MEVVGLDSPRKETAYGAVSYCWRHLQTPPALYAIKLVLVVGAFLEQAFVQPSILFGCGVSADQLILRLSQCLTEFVGQKRGVTR
jgi:hypothetical protein